LSKTSRYIVIIIVTGFVLMTVLKSFIFSNRYGGADLRTRVVAARLISTSNSPYFYKWKPADGDRFLDPLDEENRLVNGNVVTPAVLWVMHPLTILPYPQVRLIWTILLVLSGLLSVFLLCKNNNSTLIASSLTLLGFACSDAWLYNIERGQMYIFYVLFFALMYRCYTGGWKYHEFVSGFIGGFFVLFRPFAGIIGLGFLLHGRIKWLTGFGTGLILAALIFVLPNLHSWQDYFNGMQEYVNEHMGHGHTIANAVTVEKPAVIEGTSNLQAYHPFSIYRLQTVYEYLKRLGINITSRQSEMLYALVLAVLSFFFYRIKKKTSGPDTLFLFAFLVFILAEYFFTVPRGSYNIIEWMFPITIICLRGRANIPLLLVTSLGLLLLHNFPFVFPHQGELAEVIFLGLTTWSIFFYNQLNQTTDGISRV
jgi:hypothetical protein